MPGRWMSSGAISPTSTTSSTSTMQTLPAVAAAGLKLRAVRRNCRLPLLSARWALTRETSRSEEHTSELQSQSNLVCRLLLEKKKKHNLLRQEGLKGPAILHDTDRQNHDP